MCFLGFQSSTAFDPKEAVFRSQKNQSLLVSKKNALTPEILSFLSWSPLSENSEVIVVFCSVSLLFAQGEEWNSPPTPIIVFVLYAVLDCLSFE